MKRTYIKSYTCVNVIGRAKLIKSDVFIDDQAIRIPDPSIWLQVGYLLFATFQLTPSILRVLYAIVIFQSVVAYPRHHYMLPSRFLVVCSDLESLAMYVPSS